MEKIQIEKEIKLIKGFLGFLVGYITSVFFMTFSLASGSPVTLFISITFFLAGLGFLVYVILKQKKIEKTLHINTPLDYAQLQTPPKPTSNIPPVNPPAQPVAPTPAPVDNSKEEITKLKEWFGAEMEKTRLMYENKLEDEKRKRIDESMND